MSVINGWGISFEIALMSISMDLTYDKSKFVQVMVLSGIKSLPKPMLT